MSTTTVSPALERAMQDAQTEARAASEYMAHAAADRDEAARAYDISLARERQAWLDYEAADPETRDPDHVLYKVWQQVADEHEAVHSRYQRAIDTYARCERRWQQLNDPDYVLAKFAEAQQRSDRGRQANEARRHTRPQAPSTPEMQELEAVMEQHRAGYELYQQQRAAGEDKAATTGAYKEYKRAYRKLLQLRKQGGATEAAAVDA